MKVERKISGASSLVLEGLKPTAVILCTVILLLAMPSILSRVFADFMCQHFQHQFPHAKYLAIGGAVYLMVFYLFCSIVWCFTKYIIWWEETSQNMVQSLRGLWHNVYHDM